METLGVSGFWGLERIERAGFKAAQITLLLLATSIAVFYLLFGVFWGGMPNRSTSLVALFFGILNGLVLAGTVVMARWTQADLEGLMPYCPEIRPSLDLLRPNRRLVLGCFLLEAVTWGLVFHLGRYGFARVPLTSVLQNWFTLRGFFMGILLPLTLASIWTVSLVVVLSQIRSLSYASRHLEIDLFELVHYHRLAAPLARFVLFAILLLSFTPLVFQIENSGTPEALVLVSVPLLLLGIAGLVAAYVYPVWILRNRIRDAKAHELLSVFRSLGGDIGAMSKSRIHHRADSLGLSELLDYRTFIESLWEWPVAPHLHRILLVGLLPPTTWALAALVEHTVSTLLG